MTKYVVDDSKGVKPGERIPILGEFDTEEAAARFIETLPEYETGRYGLIGPSDDPEEQRVSSIVEVIPAMAAMAVELNRTRDQWAPGVHPRDLNTELAALVAYQAMSTFPPKTLTELMLWVLGVLPDAEIGEDNQGQVVIYTGLTTTTEDGPLVPMEKDDDGEG